MKRLILWIFVAAVFAGGVYWAGQEYPDKIAFWKSGTASTARKPGLNTTAIVATRDINFAVTAAGDIGPLDAVSVRPEIGGLIARLTLDIGATFIDIFIQILVESVVIAIIGGVAGLLASQGLVKVLTLVSPADYTPVITVEAMLLAFSFSVVVGVLAGIFPELKAARLHPIQALRYE